MNHPTHITPLLMWVALYGDEKLSPAQKQELKDFHESWRTK